MATKIIISKNLRNQSFKDILLTVFSHKKTIISRYYPRKIHYFKTFPSYTLEVMALQFKDILFIKEVHKNVHLSAMCK